MKKPTYGERSCLRRPVMPHVTLRPPRHLPKHPSTTLSLLTTPKTSSEEGPCRRRLERHIAHRTSWQLRNEVVEEVPLKTVSQRCRHSTLAWGGFDRVKTFGNQARRCRCCCCRCRREQEEGGGRRDMVVAGEEVCPCLTSGSPQTFPYNNHLPSLSPYVLQHSLEMLEGPPNTHDELCFDEGNFVIVVLLRLNSPLSSRGHPSSTSWRLSGVFWTKCCCHDEEEDVERMVRALYNWHLLWVVRDFDPPFVLVILVV